MTQRGANLDDAGQLMEPGHALDRLANPPLPGHLGEHRQQHPALGQERLAGKRPEALDQPVDQPGIGVMDCVLITSANHLMQDVELGADLAPGNQLLARRAEEDGQPDGQAAAASGRRRGTLRQIPLDADPARVDQRRQPGGDLAGQVPDGLTMDVGDANRAGVVPVVRLAFEIGLLAGADGGVVTLHSGDPGLDFAQKLLGGQFGGVFGLHGGLRGWLHPGGFRAGFRSPVKISGPPGQILSHPPEEFREERRRGCGNRQERAFRKPSRETIRKLIGRPDLALLDAEKDGLTGDPAKPPPQRAGDLILPPLPRAAGPTACRTSRAARSR